MKPSLSAIHGRRRGTWKLDAQIEVRAGFRLIWFLGEGHWDLVQGIRTVSVHHHYSQSELFFLVQTMANFVAGDGDGVLALGSPPSLQCGFTVPSLLLGLGEPTPSRVPGRLSESIELHVFPHGRRW